MHVILRKSFPLPIVTHFPLATVAKIQFLLKKQITYQEEYFLLVILELER